MEDSEVLETYKKIMKLLEEDVLFVGLKIRSLEEDMKKTQKK